MSSAENTQMAVCLMKFSLDELGQDLVTQDAAYPVLKAQYDEYCRDADAALQKSRWLKEQIEKLNVENMALVVKHMQLARECGDKMRIQEEARATNMELKKSLTEQEQATELMITKYENSVFEQVERFKNAKIYYDENTIKAEMDKISHESIQLKRQIEERKAVAEQLEKQLEELEHSVPQDLLDIVGKKELDEKYKAINEAYDAVQKKLNNITKKI